MDLKNTETGRVFIIGNGPSINRQDLSPLQNEKTMVSNQYFLNPRITWKPDYYFSTDRKGVKGNLKRILDNTDGMIRFFEDVWEETIDDKKTHFLKIIRRRDNPEFVLDLNKPLRSGYCVTYIQLQVAVWMGFKEIYLLGIDHSIGHFVSEEEYHNGKSHFNLELSLVEKFMRKAKEVCDSIGINIINLTDGSALDVFPMEKYEDIIEG